MTDAPTANAPSNPLQPLTQQQITQQATAYVKAAYGPAFTGLESETKQAQGLSDKRTADNQYYMNWLDQQMQAIQAHNDAANQMISSWEQNIAGQQQGILATQQQGLEAAANTRAGNVSNNSQSNMFGTSASSGGPSLVGQNEATMQGATLNAENATAHIMGNDSSMLDSARANDTAYMGAIQQKQLTDLQNTLSKLNITREGLTGKEATDITKVEQGLTSQNIKVAISNRDFAAAMQKLGLSAANINSMIQTRTANTALNQQKFGLDLSKAQFQQMNADRNYQLHVSQFNAATAKDLYERNHGLGPYKSGSKALGQASQNVIFNRISGVRTTLTQLTQALGSRQMAWQAMHHGYYTDSKGTVHYLKGAGTGGDDGILNSAYNTMTGAGGLTSGDVHFLESLGLVIGNRLPVVPNYGSSQNYQGPH